MEITVQNLEFSYGLQQILAIRESRFESGKIYGIVGNNGGGKTTFFKTLTNIITNYSGRIAYEGIDVKTNPALLSKVGITLDDMELFKNHTGLFNIHYFAGLRGQINQTKVDELAKNLGITEALKQKVSSYSLGMNKKLILLISLMNDAEVLIFDEPFRGIDLPSVEWLHNYLKNLKDQGKLILISSHVQEDIENLCDEVFALSNGDFRASFDLTNSQQELTYTVEVSDVQAFITCLPVGTKALTKDHLVRFDSRPDAFQEIFRKATAKGIDFSEIKKVSKFTKFLGQQQ